MVKEQNLTKKTHNGLLKGLLRVICNKCLQSETTTVELGPITRCPFCNSKDINVMVGNKPEKKRVRQSLQILTKLNGGKLKMASEKVKKALQMLKEEGVDTNVVTDEPKAVEDETTGEVGSDETEEYTIDEGLILEKADVGRGLQLSRDYSKDSRYKRLSR